MIKRFGFSLLVLVLLHTAAGAVHSALPNWVLLHDLREYNTVNWSMPASTTTDATPAWPPPTTVLALRFSIPREAVDCSNLVVDLPLVRQVGVHSRTPKFISMWIWAGLTALDSGTLDGTATAGHLRWSGNVSLPASLVNPQAANTTTLMTHRFVLPTFQPALPAATGYWLGVSVGIDRAYHPLSRTFNEVRWAPASTSIPQARLTTGTAIYRATDRFGNGAALRTPALSSWVSALVAEPALLQPPGSNSSVTHRLAALICGRCSGVLDAASPLLLIDGPPDPYGSSSPSPTPTPVLVTPSSAQDIGPSPPLAPTWASSPTPVPVSGVTPSSSSSSSSSQGPAAPYGSSSPSPTPTLVLVTPSSAQDIGPSPSPGPGVSAPSAQVIYPPAPAGPSWWTVVAIISLAGGVLFFCGVLVFIFARRYVRHHGDYTRAARTAQGTFTDVNEVSLDTILGSDSREEEEDPSGILLDDTATEADLSGADKEPFSDELKEVPLIDAPTNPKKKKKGEHRE